MNKFVQNSNIVISLFIQILCKQIYIYIFVKIKHDRKFVKINNSMHVESNCIILLVLEVKLDISYPIIQSPD